MRLFIFILALVLRALFLFLVSDMLRFGVLAVNKPTGCSSRHVVDRIERLVRPAKAGHAGTLDPLATGVLVICVGKATRLIPYVQRMPKTYRAKFLLGRCSDTDDIEGEVTPLEHAPVPTAAAVKAALESFLGEIQQVPPAHSAVKVGGRRAYQLARAGKPIALAPRMVTIRCLRISHYEYPELGLDIECGSGTYIRALGRDLARLLGTAAVMSELERSAIGPFHIDAALPLHAASSETVASSMNSPLAAIPDAPRIVLNDLDLIEIQHGRPIDMPQGIATDGPSTEYAGVDSSENLLAILAEKTPRKLWPKKTFF